jgi:hypothetical protein
MVPKNTPQGTPQRLQDVLQQAQVVLHRLHDVVQRLQEVVYRLHDGMQ